MEKKGEIVIVGTGMMLGAHICPRSRSFIEQADVVFAGVSDYHVELWIQEMNPNTISLQQFYAEGKSRHITYNEMLESMMCEVRGGKRVVGAFYGHPGVFAWAPHEVIRMARSEGFEAHMEPGVSAEDAMIADVGFDPGQVGCLSFEATQFLNFEKPFDVTSYLILWQVGVVGDMTVTKFKTGPEERNRFIDMLCTHYNPDHEVVLYEAPTLPVHQARIDRIKLKDFVDAELTLNTTMLVPPMTEMRERTVA